MTSPLHLKITHEQARRLTLDSGQWLSCDDCFELVDQYVQAVVDESGVTPVTQDVYGHLQSCAACNEEAQTLISLVRAQQDGT